MAQKLLWRTQIQAVPTYRRLKCFPFIFSYFFVKNFRQFLRSGKNTDQFYGIFCVNICGALITAKNTIIFTVEKNTEIFYGIFYANISENICGA